MGQGQSVQDHHLRNRLLAQAKTPEQNLGGKILIGFAVGKYMEASCTIRGHSRFFAVIFVVYWLHLASHAVDQDKARLLTPERYERAHSLWTPKPTQQGTLWFTIHAETADNPEHYILTEEEKTQQTTDKLVNESHGAQDLIQNNTPDWTATRSTCMTR